MKLDELKELIGSEVAEAKAPEDFMSYFVLLGYGYPGFSIHMDISSKQLASMLVRASKDCKTIKTAILAAAAVLYKRIAEEEGGEQ